MLVVDSPNGSFEVVYNFYTLYIYEQEFGSDLIKDLYGNSAAEVDETGSTFHFGAVNWTAVAKALWAGAKSADDRTPRFRDWAATIGSGISLFDVAGEVVEEINKELFRFGVAAVS